ncbi:MAG: phosphomethylpyrimidine kinase, partial [Lachnospiraceae bacterium]|nr:phosphomethylpyrimidine kinase [Candidatus Colinaster scatohippi]
MTNKKVITIQDISCYGQCSLTVALPIISACGVETAILPSAVLSTHTGGFTGYTIRDLTDDIPGIINHWEKESLKFDCLYTGYLGSITQIDYVLDMYNRILKDNGMLIVDPAMADNGSLYYGFNQEFVANMARLCGNADIILP